MDSHLKQHRISKPKIRNNVPSMLSYLAHESTPLHQFIFTIRNAKV